MNKKAPLTNTAKRASSKDSFLLRKLNPHKDNIDNSIQKESNDYYQYYNVGSSSQQLSNNDAEKYDDQIQEENINDQVYYDQEIMNQIEMEIYKANLDNGETTVEHKTSFEENDQTTDLEEYTDKKKIKNKSKESSLKTQTSNKEKENEKEKEKEKISKKFIIPEKPTKPTEPDAKKIQTQSEEQSQISVPLKTQKPSNKPSHPRSSQTIQGISKPSKKLKGEQNVTKPMIKFKIHPKLMKQKLQVKRIIKCMDGKIKDRSQAYFMVQVQGRGDPEMISNSEMIYFYKDVLIDYYQDIHFTN